jgi:hypothetical protein
MLQEKKKEIEVFMNPIISDLVKKTTIASPLPLPNDQNNCKRIKNQ